MSVALQVLESFSDALEDDDDHVLWQPLTFAGVDMQPGLQLLPAWQRTVTSVQVGTGIWRQNLLLLLLTVCLLAVHIMSSSMMYA